MFDQVAALRESSSAIVIASAVFAGIAFTAVALRAISRPLMHVKYGQEDWFLLAAAILFLPMAGFNIAGAIRGKTAVNDLDPGFLDYLKYDWIAGILYFPAICCVDLSILSLYRRTFITPQFRQVSLGVMIATVIWTIPGFIVEVATCLPIASFWDPSIPGTCLYYSTFWITMGISEIVLDIIIFLLPIRQIFKLQLSVEKKFALGGVFAIGGISIITGTVRLPMSYLPGQYLIILAQDCLWVNVHVGTAVLSACLPPLRPLFGRVFKGLTSFSTKYSTKYSNSKYGSELSSAERSEPYQKFGINEERVKMTDSVSWSDREYYNARDGVNGPREVEDV